MIYTQVDESRLPDEIEFVVTEKQIKGFKGLVDLEDLDIQILKIASIVPCPKILITREDCLDIPGHWVIMDNIRSRLIAAGFKIANDWRRT